MAKSSATRPAKRALPSKKKVARAAGTTARAASSRPAQPRNRPAVSGTPVARARPATPSTRGGRSRAAPGKPPARDRAAAPNKGPRSHTTARASGQRRGKAAAVPPQYGTATPHLIVSPCAEALEFYAKAFGATLQRKMAGPGGLVMHAEMKIGDSIVMCSDEMPVPGRPSTRKAPRTAGATTGGVMLYLEDVDAAFERAIAAGATAVMPPADQFWGDRYAQIEDPFGHVWAMATHLRDMSDEEINAAIAQMSQQGASAA